MRRGESWVARRVPGREPRAWSFHVRLSRHRRSPGMQGRGSMIEEAWNEFRGWAKRARTLQTSSRQWSRVALVCAGLAAILGTAASQVTDGSILGRTLAFLAAVVAAVTPIFGREILSVESEARWIRARATAEAIKSECFRFAAQLGDYAVSSGTSSFIAKRNTLTEQAERAG